MSTQKVEQEKEYKILQNAAGKLMFLIRARLENAVEPRVAYDGGDRAILYRNTDHTLVLNYVHPAVRDLLAGAPKVLVVEAQNGAIVREYAAEVKCLKALPL